MSTIKVRIDGHECQGTVKERTKGSRPSKSGAGYVEMQFIFVDLEAKCVLSADVPPPPAEVEIAGVWKTACIERIPTGPDFRRIHLSFAE